jgi:hypothetical protein
MRLGGKLRFPCALRENTGGHRQKGATLVAFNCYVPHLLGDALSAALDRNSDGSHISKLRSSNGTLVGTNVFFVRRTA